MWNLIKWEVKSNRKNLFFWSLGTIVFTAICFFEYTAMAESEESMEALFGMMPRIVKVMFGMGRLPIDEPEGYYACMFLWICLLTFAHAAMLGGNLLAKEERDKTAEFLNTKPISRSRILAGKITAGIVNVLIINLLCYVMTLSCFLPLVTGSDMLRPVSISMAGMLIGQIFMLALGLCISAVVKNYRRAVLYSALAMIMLYLLGVIFEMAEVYTLNFLTPFRAFNAADVMEEGLRAGNVVITAAAIFFMGGITRYYYQRRNLQI